MKVGDRVRKIKGYSFQGYVVAVFITLAGNERLVVEHEDLRGLLHIYSETDLEKIK